jgi:AraC family transcriptional regulator, regulatory protein of adaptative response / methylated-DNA-[protein]-cysteine methyltransferase
MTRTSNADWAEAGARKVLIPVIRTAATIGFAIAPCSLGFVIIAVSEHLIRSIRVGEDPEMLVSDLQNQFPDEALEVMEDDHTGLVPKVLDLIERPGKLELPRDADDIRIHVSDALNRVPTGALLRETHSYAK